MTYPQVAWAASVKLLDAKVSFEVKDAAFLTILDGLLTTANVPCDVEARGLRSMKISMRFKEAKAGSLLDAFAKAGGARLWVFPTKLLLAPESLLTAEEKKTAKLYGVLQTRATLPKGSAIGLPREGGKISVIDTANTHIAVQFQNTSWRASEEAIRAPNGFYQFEATSPGFNDGTGHFDPAILMASFPDVTIGDAWAFFAHANGCELYLTPDELIVCPSASAPDSDPKVTIPAFTASSTHFDFGSHADPSAKGS